MRKFKIDQTTAKKIAMEYSDVILRGLQNDERRQEVIEYFEMVASEYSEDNLIFR